jgi:4-amino-4-deoxy-L-arabinose transferase-like glycosyltransferase
VASRLASRRAGRRSGAASRPRPAGSLRARTWGPPWLALLAIFGIAAGLRGVGLQYGLPFGNLLNPDEQSIVPRAWAMVHGAGGDPHWFDYPTLLMYVLAPFQSWQAVPGYLTARIVVAVLGVAAVAATWWLGRRAYGTLAGAVGAAAVAVDTTAVAYSHAAVTDVALVAAATAALALMVSGRIELAGLAAGIATSFKYPGVFLLAPLVVAAWGTWRRLAVGAALALGAFLAGSPFVAAHPGQAWDDASRVQRLARDGWLGFEHDHWAGIAFVQRLWNGLGPALIVCGAGIAVAAWRRRRADVILLAFVAVYFADLLTLRAHFDRYVLPLVPPLGVLAGRLRPLAPVTLLLLVVPLTWSIKNDITLTRTDTRVVAARWIVRHVPEDSRVATESSTPTLPAGYSIVGLALPGPGRPFDPDRNVGRLRREGVAYVVVTGAIADRVLAARDRYPREARFYGDLHREAKRIYYRARGGGLTGPWVAVYRLSSSS